jgi:hypothetical protein
LTNSGSRTPLHSRTALSSATQPRVNMTLLGAYDRWALQGRSDPPARTMEDQAAGGTGDAAMGGLVQSQPIDGATWLHSAPPSSSGNCHRQRAGQAATERLKPPGLRDIWGGSVCVAEPSRQRAVSLHPSKDQPKARVLRR